MGIFEICNHPNSEEEIFVSMVYMNKDSGLKETLFSEVVPVNEVKYISYNLPNNFVETVFVLAVDTDNKYSILDYNIKPVYPLNGIDSNYIFYADDSDQKELEFKIIPNAHHYLGLELTVGEFI